MSNHSARQLRRFTVGILLFCSTPILCAMAEDDAIPAPPEFGAPALAEAAMTFRLGDQGRCDYADGGEWDLNGKALHIVLIARASSSTAEITANKVWEAPQRRANSAGVLYPSELCSRLLL